MTIGRRITLRRGVSGFTIVLVSPVPGGSSSSDLAFDLLLYFFLDNFGNLKWRSSSFWLLFAGRHLDSFCTIYLISLCYPNLNDSEVLLHRRCPFRRLQSVWFSLIWRLRFRFQQWWNPSCMSQMSWPVPWKKLKSINMPTVYRKRLGDRKTRRCAVDCLADNIFT